MVTYNAKLSPLFSGDFSTVEVKGGVREKREKLYLIFRELSIAGWNGMGWGGVLSPEKIL